jgi:hypothetical protein
MDVDYKTKICEANYSLINFIFFEFIKKILKKILPKFDHTNCKFRFYLLKLDQDLKSSRLTY